jgi:hypothetical protein
MNQIFNFVPQKTREEGEREVTFSLKKSYLHKLTSNSNCEFDLNKCKTNHVNDIVNSK